MNNLEKPLHVSLLIILISVLASPLFGRADSSGSRTAVTLGAIVSLTGDAARNGQNWLEGAELAVDELNQRGTPTKLIVEDDGTNPGRVATAFVKLASVDKVGGILGGTWDFLAETAFPLARQYKVPFITPTNPIEIFSAAAQANPWIFTNGVSLGAEREVIRNFLSKQGSKRIGLVYINVPYGTSHAELVREVAKELGASVVSDDEITYQAFRDTLKLAALHISERKPDTVFLVSNYEGADALLRELERMQSAPVVLMTHNLKEAFDFGGSATRYKNAYGIFPKFHSEKFESAFTKKYGRSPVDYAAAGYDAVMFMSQLVGQGMGAKPEAANLVYEGVTGRHVLPSTSRSVVAAQAVVMELKGAGLVEHRS